MANVVRVIGADKLKRQLKKEKLYTERRVEKGLLAGGLMLQRLSQLIVPIDTAALKNSAKTLKEGKGKKTVVTVQYETAYAIFVHEDLYARHQPGKTAKYLERPIKEQTKEITDAIFTAAKR